jgi:hypothetical protein
MRDASNYRGARRNAARPEITDHAQVSEPAALQGKQDAAGRCGRTPQSGLEFVMKEFKRIGFKDALRAIGLK